GCQRWHEFRTPAAMQLILGGLGNIDHCRTEAGDFYEGASLRLYDKSAKLWRIYWMDTSGATLYPPVEGAFRGAVGTFRGIDRHNGIPVLVEFRWDKTNVMHPYGNKRSQPTMVRPGKQIGTCTSPEVMLNRLTFGQSAEPSASMPQKAIKIA